MPQASGFTSFFTSIELNGLKKQYKYYEIIDLFNNLPMLFSLYLVLNSSKYEKQRHRARA